MGGALEEGPAAASLSSLTAVPGPGAGAASGLEGPGEAGEAAALQLELAEGYRTKEPLAQQGPREHTLSAVRDLSCCIVLIYKTRGEEPEHPTLAKSLSPHSNLLQHSCPGIPWAEEFRGLWVRGVAELDTTLQDTESYTQFYLCLNSL